MKIVGEEWRLIIVQIMVTQPSTMFELKNNFQNRSYIFNGYNVINWTFSKVWINKLNNVKV